MSEGVMSVIATIIVLIILIGTTVTIILALYSVLILVTERLTISRIHRAIVNIYEKGSSNLEKCYDEILLNYNRLVHTKQFSSLLDCIESLICYYDSFTPKGIKYGVGFKVKEGMKPFLIEMREYIRKEKPYISVPTAEAEYMRIITTALSEKNESLGKQALTQLSTEIIKKEKHLRSAKKTNMLAIVISILSIVLTIFFGIYNMPQTGDEEGVGTYICNTCGQAVVLDDNTNTLPPCPKCNSTDYHKSTR